MSGNSKVIWSEGMFLRPQHFQQQDRYVENFINNRCLGLQPCSWGFYNLTIDRDRLKTGKLALLEARGIFPDGTPFKLPDDDDLPLPLDLDETCRNEFIYLSLPLRLPENPEVEHSANGGGLSRFRLYERQIRDSANLIDGRNSTETSAPVNVGKLRTRLLRQTDERSGFTCLAVVHVLEARADNTIIIDDRFIPPALNCLAQNCLNGFLTELHGLLNSRSENMAGRVAAPDMGRVSESEGFLILQLLNRYLPLFGHLAVMDGLHPELFFRYGIQLAGELATFFQPNRQPAALPPYNHKDLQATFSPLMEELRFLLNASIVEKAIPLELLGPQHGLYVARNPGADLVTNYIFVLAARADMHTENLRREFEKQTIIAPFEDIRQYVNSLTTAIAIKPLAAVPRQIPYHTGFVYFELDQHTDLWKKMVVSKGFAIHIAANYPGLKLELWAIKEG